jgi:hypothetical protein
VDEMPTAQGAAMTTPTSPDPDPANTPGLERGGGVAPGDTPPGESSTSGAIDHQPAVASTRANWIAYAFIGVVVLAVLLFFGGYIAGLID